jgi:SAM-dependent methyltransferase
MEKELIENLCCPVCRGELSTCDGLFVCIVCCRRYPIVQGRPVLVPFVADERQNAEVLLAAANSLPVRDSVMPRKYCREFSVEEFFFRRLFRQFNRRYPQWAFLGRKVAEMVRNIPEGACVLDLGAGECKYAALLSHCRYVGIDLVSSSDKHDFSRIDVVADASAIPFRDCTFDVALNLVVLEHVPDPELTVREMVRILKPSGLVFALIPLVRPEHLVPYDFHRFTRYGIQRLFEDNGLQVESLEGSNGALWTAVHYMSLITKTQPLAKYGRRSFRGLFWNRFWSLILYPLVVYARTTDCAYGGDFPIYFWVRAVKKEQFKKIQA